MAGVSTSTPDFNLLMAVTERKDPLWIQEDDSTSYFSQKNKVESQEFSSGTLDIGQNTFQTKQKVYFF